MKDVIKLNCREGEKHYLKKLSKPDSQESKTYVLKLSNYYVRVGKIDNSDFIDPSGGPMIIVGSSIPEADGAIVKSIDFVMGYGYTITFE